MAASVRIEDEAFSDTRYDALAQLAGLTDADHARGKMIRLWRQCTVEHNHLVSEIDVMAVLGARGVDAILSSRLAERVGSDGRCIRIKGTKGRIEWLKHLRDNGKRGGRPSNQMRTKTEPSGLGAHKPDANPPAPAPVPSLKEKRPPRRGQAEPPSLTEVLAYFAARGKGLDGEAFHAHYEANGWVQSNGRPIKKWKAAVVTWEKNAARFGPKNAPEQTAKPLSDFDIRHGTYNPHSGFQKNTKLCNDPACEACRSEREVAHD